MDEGHRPELQFSPILIVLLGVIAGSTMIATYHCISIGCCCYHRRAQNQQNLHQNIQRNQQEGHSATRSNTAIKLIPVFRYSKECSEETCSVCLCEFNEGEQIRVLPECLHLFHVPCIDIWLSSHSNCPLCRADAAPPLHVVLSLPDSGGAPPPDFAG